VSAYLSALGLFAVTAAAAIAWLWGIEGLRPTTWDLAGAAIALAGMALIVLQPAR